MAQDEGMLPAYYHRSGEGVLRRLVGCVPCRAWRRGLRRRTGLDADEWFRRHFCLSVWKALGLAAHRGEIRELALGSSHAAYGYWADEASFNLGDMSCDLYHSFHLLRYALSLGMPALRRVVLFYDVFSPCFRIDRSSAAFHVIPWRALCGVPPRTGETVRQDAVQGFTFDELSAAFDARIASYRPDVSRYRGNLDYAEAPLADPGCLGKRCAGHLRRNRGEDTETRWVSEMARMLRPVGASLTIVVPPVRADYRTALGVSADELFANVRRTAAALGDVSVLVLHDSPAFADEDFGDMDHLVCSGARKLKVILENLPTDGGCHSVRAADGRGGR